MKCDCLLNYGFTCEIIFFQTKSKDFVPQKAERGTTDRCTDYRRRRSCPRHMTLTLSSQSCSPLYDSWSLAGRGLFAGKISMMMMMMLMMTMMMMMIIILIPKKRNLNSHHHHNRCQLR